MGKNWEIVSDCTILLGPRVYGNVGVIDVEGV